MQLANFPHEFANPDLLEAALSPASSEHQRLEWLGDRVLGCGLAMLLHSHYPDREPGDLTRAFAQLACNSYLHKVAQKLELHEKGASSEASALKEAAKVEALLGAVMLDSGAETALQCVAKLFEDDVVALNDASWRKDTKSELKELCEGKKAALPEYSHEEGGEGHMVRCAAMGLTAEGSGASKQEAEMAAAGRILEQLAAKAEPA